MNLSFAAARDALMAGLFADTDRAEKGAAHFALDMLSDWLPYRVYDERAGLYRNRASKGSVGRVSLLPLVSSASANLLHGYRDAATLREFAAPTKEQRK